jgi:tRNA-dihydrouridine synthase 3
LTSTATNAPEEAAHPTPAGSLSASVTHEFPPYCPVFQDLGHCPLGWKCRFLSAHVEKVDASVEDNGKTVVDGYRIKGSLLDDGLTEEERLRRERRDEVNWIEKKAMSAIRSGKVSFWRQSTRH